VPESAAWRPQRIKRCEIVFCGTPSFAVPTLKHLLAQSDFEILAAITQPDRPRGRGQEVSFSAVKETALAAKLAVHQPEKIRASESEALLRELAPDCIVIIAYGQIIPARLLRFQNWAGLICTLPCSLNTAARRPSTGRS